MVLQYIRGFVTTPKQVKPQSPESWIPSYSSLQPYVNYFYKFVTYYIFDNKYDINTWNIRRHVVGYIMSLKRKRKSKLNANNCEEDKYHLIFNNILTSSSIILQSNTHKGCCILNTSN